MDLVHPLKLPNMIRLKLLNRVSLNKLTGGWSKIYI
jgi:hypothetical protein